MLANTLSTARQRAIPATENNITQYNNEPSVRNAEAHELHYRSMDGIAS